MVSFDGGWFCALRILPPLFVQNLDCGYSPFPGRSYSSRQDATGGTPKEGNHVGRPPALGGNASLYSEWVTFHNIAYLHLGGMS